MAHHPAQRGIAVNVAAVEGRRDHQWQGPQDGDPRERPQRSTAAEQQPQHHPRGGHQCETDREQDDSENRARSSGRHESDDDALDRRTRRSTRTHQGRRRRDRQHSEQPDEGQGLGRALRPRPPFALVRLESAGGRRHEVRTAHGDSGRKADLWQLAGSQGTEHEAHRLVPVLSFRRFDLRLLDLDACFTSTSPATHANARYVGSFGSGGWACIHRMDAAGTTDGFSFRCVGPARTDSSGGPRKAASDGRVPSQPGMAKTKLWQ